MNNMDSVLLKNSTFLAQKSYFEPMVQIGVSIFPWEKINCKNNLFFTKQSLYNGKIKIRKELKMTPNKLTKNNILEMYNEIDEKDFLEKTNYTKLLAFQGVLLNERECCIHQWYEGSETKPLTPRNISCFKSFTNCLNENDLKGAWWELIDILTDVHDDEYLEIDETILFSFALDLFVKGLHKNADRIH